MKDKALVVMVTGAAGNVGRALLDVLAAQGASVVAIDRQAPAPEVLAPFGQDRLLALPGVDLADPAACAGAVAAGIERFGRLDGVAHTVGGFVWAESGDAGADMFDAMFRLNVLTTLNVFRAALPAMRGAGGGSLVAIGAGSALKAPAGLSAYAAAKSGVHRVVESFADEVKRDRVRVNAVLPSIIDTQPNRDAMPGADFASWVSAKEVAQAMAFLLSPQASGVTGALLPVPGRV